MEGLQLSMHLGTARRVSGTQRMAMGEVFTRRWVVDLILDLAGYTPERDLARKLAVEPSCGKGAFLEPMVLRLVASAKVFGRDLSECMDAIRAFDLQAENVEVARKLVTGALNGERVPIAQSMRLAELWVQRKDFLLDAPADLGADFVIGNPPYVRLEDVPLALTLAYRRACPSMRGRSDLYVGFLERALRMLGDGGSLGFIVADRWMHNQYGADLRQLISREFSVEVVLEMHDTDAFEEAVSAYPAITIIQKRPQGKAVLAKATKSFGTTSAGPFASWVMRSHSSVRVSPTFSGARLPRWFEGPALWPSGDPQAVALVRSLEDRFPPLEDPQTGTRVRIGVATGADQVFLTSDRSIAEGDRLLPLVMNEDITSGNVNWTGTFLVNPWTESGLVGLEGFPRLAAYYAKHREQLEGRHIAKVRPTSWYRTIDRVWPELLDQPKLLLPDMKAFIHPVLEPGGLYPHHNLYYVVSSRWDLEVLGGVLLSDIANLFVGTYCVKMRGNCYRFQAQYLRKIRVPPIDTVGAIACRGLRAAFVARDAEKATALSMQLFGLDELPPSVRRR